MSAIISEQRQDQDPDQRVFQVIPCSRGNRTYVCVLVSACVLDAKQGLVDKHTNSNPCAVSFADFTTFDRMKADKLNRQRISVTGSECVFISYVS